MKKQPAKAVVLRQLQLENKVKKGLISITLIGKFESYKVLKMKGVSKEKIIKFCRNGKNFGEIAELLMECNFKKFKECPEGSQKNYDVIDSYNGRKYEARCFTDRGVSLIPSNQMGKGRCYKEAEYKEKLRTIHGYILWDIHDISGIIRVYKVESKKQKNAMRIFDVFGKRIEKYIDLRKLSTSKNI